MSLTADEIDRVCRLVDEIAGIQWDKSKAYLIESRLPSLLADFGCASFGDLVTQVREGKNPALRTAFIDAITTRETLFFRDEGPFDALKHKALPEIIDAKQGTPFAKRIRIWSAACSSGQEPYSIGIVLCDLFDDIESWDVEILATDLSPAALESASKGLYSDFEMSRGVPHTIRNRFFEKQPTGWRICEKVRRLVRFEPRNLLEPFQSMGPFDAVFCRNVAIYFDEKTRRDLFERLAGVLSTHGALFVGSSENLSSYGERWKPLHHCRGVFYLPNRASVGPVATREGLGTAGVPTASRVPSRRPLAAGTDPTLTPRELSRTVTPNAARHVATAAVATVASATSATRVGTSVLAGAGARTPAANKAARPIASGTASPTAATRQPGSPNGSAIRPATSAARPGSLGTPVGAGVAAPRAVSSTASPANAVSRTTATATAQRVAATPRAATAVSATAQRATASKTPSPAPRAATAVPPTAVAKSVATTVARSTTTGSTTGAVRPGAPAARPATPQTSAAGPSRTAAAAVTVRPLVSATTGPTKAVVSTTSTGRTTLNGAARAAAPTSALASTPTAPTPASSRSSTVAKPTVVGTARSLATSATARK